MFRFGIVVACLVFAAVQLAVIVALWREVLKGRLSDRPGLVSCALGLALLLAAQIGIGIYLVLLGAAYSDP